LLFIIHHPSSPPHMLILFKPHIHYIPFLDTLRTSSTLSITFGQSSDSQSCRQTAASSLSPLLRNHWVSLDTEQT
jgi:hypothetical protein